MSLSSIDDKNIKLFENQSIINGRIIYDKEILENIGSENYIMLSRKYPKYFKMFPECRTLSYNGCWQPGIINITISNDPEIIKLDIVKTIFYKIRFSNNSDLVKEKVDYKVTEIESSVSIWIIICMIFVILIFLSIFIIYDSEKFQNKFKNVKLITSI